MSDNIIFVPQFSRKHAATLLHVHPRTVKRWLGDGYILGYKIGRRKSWYIDLREINRIREDRALPSLTAAEAAGKLGMFIDRDLEYI